jgi:murein DD-endopeptidase MepM/ murein hydrolase activator NlpD
VSWRHRIRDLARRRISILVMLGPDHGVRRFSFPALAIPAAILVVGLGFAGGGAATVSWTSARVHELRAFYLRRENDRLVAQLREIRDSVDAFHARVEETAEMEREFRNIANLEAISSDVRMLGVGGPPPLSELEDQASIFPTVREARETLSDIAQLNRQAAGAFVSSRYGIRQDPFTGEPCMHSGIDFSASEGTPVRATAAGFVREAGGSGTLGLLVVIDHDNGIVTRYGHNSRIRVTAGQRVQRGDIIAEVGSTGRSTSPHCHYEIHCDGRAVNPIRYILGEALASSSGS